MTFDDVMKLTQTVSAEAAFNMDACRAFYDTVMKLSPCSTIVEVGVEYGRSTSILAQVAKEQGYRLLLIDPFVTKRTGPKVVEMLLGVGAPFTLYCMTTAEFEVKAPWSRDIRIDLLHIDGDHTRENVERDCAMFLPMVSAGGYACFHDYGRDSLPDVFPVVNEYTKNDGWEEVGTFGTLHVVRRK